MGFRTKRRRNKLKIIDMKTGTELIAIERQEQIEKHKWDKEHDKSHVDGELKFAALYALGEKSKLQPYAWDWFRDKMEGKTEVEKLVIAGALIASEIDRLNSVSE